MSLLDLLDKVQGGTAYGGGSFKVPKSKPFDYKVPVAPVQSGNSASARNSRERTAPERVDVSNMFAPPPPAGEEAPNVPLQTLEIVGRAPGFIAERPLAVADSLLQGEDGSSPFDFIGQIPGAQLLGDVVNNISALPGAVANASTASSLAQGVREGWGDDTLIDTTLDQIGRNPIVSGVLGGLNPGIGIAMQQNAKKQPRTWGEFKADAARKGWTAEDVQGVIEGTKNTYDFGDKAMSSDPMTEMALRIGSDPFNLIFGAGAAFKAIQGVGLMGKAVKAGAVAGKLEAPSVVAANLAANASMAGIEVAGKGATWLGLAKAFGEIGQTLSAVPGAVRGIEAGAKAATATGKGLKAYQKVAVGTTGVQLGLLGAAQTPLSGPLAGLFEINQKAWDNQPLSQNSAFALFTAFHFDLTHLAGKGLGELKGIKRAALGDDTRARMLDALSEDFHGEGKNASHKEVIEALGGPSVLDDLIVHTHAQAAFSRIMNNPVVKASLSHFDSLDEAMLKNAKLGEMIKTIVADDYKNGRTNGRQTVEGFKGWFAQRSGIEQSLDIPWNGRHAVERWTQFAGAASSVSQIFRERGGVVMGLVDDIMSEDVWNLQALARIAGGSSKAVPVADIRGWLSRFPTMLDEGHAVYGRDAAWWAQYLTDEWAGKTVPLGKIEGKLKRLGKDAPTARDYTSEMAAAERAVSQDEWVAAQPESYASTGRASINVSRVRPGIVKRLGIRVDDIDSASTARTDPAVAAFEGRVGEELTKLGFRVDETTQAVGVWNGGLEASVEIVMSEATLPEIRLAAALAGQAAQQDSVVLAVGGRRMRELGLSANGYEVVLSLPNVERDSLRAVSAAVVREFDGATINDTTGVVRILVKEGDEAAVTAKLASITDSIGDLYERDALGASTVKSSVHPAYVEFLDQKKGSNATFSDVIRESKSYGDERAAAAKSLASAVAHARGDAANAPGGLGSPDAVGRNASNGGPATGHLSKPPAERVGVGRVAEATHEPGFVYHATKADNLAPIAEGTLTPQGPKAMKHTDGGTGRRTYWSAKPIDTVPFGDTLLRVSEKDAGRVRTDRIEGQNYSQKNIQPSLVEVWGADGKWHRLDTWFEATVEPEIAAAAAPVQGIYSSPSVARAQFRDRMQGAFELTDVEADDVATLADARARAWASMAPERTIDQWYEKNFAAIESGGQPGTFHQVVRRNEGIQEAQGNDEALRVLIEEAEPPVLAEHGLGGTSELEWVRATNGREVGIPGGVEGLKEGEFTLWDLWRLKSQGIDPKILPEDLRIGLYGKLFRSQRRGLTSVPDVFNRMSFAILSPQTNLTQNEALLSFVRAQDEGGIARLAELADSVGEGASNSDIGFAIQKATGLDTSVDTLGVGIKTITTNGNLGAVGRLAQLMRDHPDFFVIREGEDLLQYSERLMNVTPGAGMKVGNFSAMLGNPLEWDRGTIDSHIVKQLVDEGRLDQSLADRLKGQSPSAQTIVYRNKKTGEINPAVPEHLRDLPVEPSDNKVRIYGGDYMAANEALKTKFGESGLADEFGLGAYQWYVWDQKRGRFEPHTLIFPGSHVLPPIEMAALSDSLKAHKAAGYLGGAGTQPLAGMAMSPRAAFFFQKGKKEPTPGGARDPRRINGPGSPIPWDLLTEAERAEATARADFHGHLSYEDYVAHTEAAGRTPDSLEKIAADRAAREAQTEVIAEMHAANQATREVERARSAAWRAAGEKPGSYLHMKPTTMSDADWAVIDARQKAVMKAAGLDGPASPAAPEAPARPRWADGVEGSPNHRLTSDAPDAETAGLRVARYREVRDWLRETENSKRDDRPSAAPDRQPGERPAWLDDATTERLLELEHERIEAIRITSSSHMKHMQNVKGKAAIVAAEAAKNKADRAINDLLIPLAREDAPTPLEGGDTIIKGSTQFLEDNRAILRGIESPDVSTGVHELAHVIANELDEADLEVLRRVHGDNPEGMPRDFERWLREGKAPVPELEGVFSRMRDALRRIYAVLKGSPLESKIHPEMRSMFERLFREVEPEATQMFDPTPDTLTAGLRAMQDELTAPGQVTWMAARDAEVSSSIPFHRSLGELDDAAKAELAAFEENLRIHYPEYTLQAAPNPAIMMADQGDIATRYLRNRTALGNVLADWGPLSRVTELAHWLTSPVPNHRLGRAARAALMNELIPHGAKPKDVDRFIKALDEAARMHTVGKFETRLFGSGRAMFPQSINKIAAEVFGPDTVKAIGQGNFHRVLDRAGNRFIRTLDERGKKGGKRGALSRAIAGGYGAYQHTAVGDVTRLVSKSFYPIFRFLSDPRWWAMNILEADLLAGTRYGASASRIRGAQHAQPGQASLMHRHQHLGPAAAKRIEDEMFGDSNGMVWTRGHAGYISRAFDQARPETTLEALRALPDNDPVLQGLRNVIEAEDAKTGRVRTAGELVDADYVQAIDRLLYEVDVKGAKAAITDEANAILGADETARLLPFLQKVWERNDATHDAITQTLTGNHSRTNLERIGNSYWLYWPLSYQVKATKWLVDVMTNRFMGAKTNLAPAALYAHHVEEHRNRLASNPEYAQMFEDSPTAWFMAQMLFPMTPGDIGVSLSRPVRYAGEELGIWGKYKLAEDPLSAAGAVLMMGPTYTAELLARLGREVFRKPASNLAP